jgi:hypothetical protein
MFMCPHCGWKYDPSVDGTGYELVPNHRYDGVTCPGQDQHPRNSESDRRVLWNGLKPMPELLDKGHAPAAQQPYQDGVDDQP